MQVGSARKGDWDSFDRSYSATVCGRDNGVN